VQNKNQKNNYQLSIINSKGRGFGRIFLYGENISCYAAFRSVANVYLVKSGKSRRELSIKNVK